MKLLPSFYILLDSCCSKGAQQPRSTLVLLLSLGGKKSNKPAEVPKYMRTRAKTAEADREVNRTPGLMQPVFLLLLLLRARGISDGASRLNCPRT